MDMHCDWVDAQKTMILLQVNRTWSWEDYAVMRDTINTLAMSVSNPVYYIIDHSRANVKLLGTQSMLMVFTETVATMPSNVTGLYLVEFPTVLKMFFRTLKRISTLPLLKTVTFCQDVTCAIDLIQQKQTNTATCGNQST